MLPRISSIEVNSFLSKFHEDSNLFPNTECIESTQTINYEDQIQQKVFEFLSLNNIGYHDEGEEQRLRSIAYSICQLCQHTNKYRERLSHNSVTLFETCPLLSSIKHCVLTGRNISTKTLPNISIEELNVKMESCLSIKSKFPSRFSKKR